MSHPPLDGLINLHKPTGITSARALYRVRAITGQRKSGHAGTLDPGASGVLLLCLGRGTKLVETLMDLPKVYRATARLDVTSESFDSDRPLTDVPVDHPPTGDEVRAACSALTGTILQSPPRISAVKIGGVPSYKRARRNEPELLPQPRPVTVYWMHVHRYAWPVLDFETACGRGTYIRALIRDIGLRLGTGGCLTSLVRLRVGPFTLNEAWTLEQLAAHPNPQAFVLPLEEARIRLSADVSPLLHPVDTAGQDLS